MSILEFTVCMYFVLSSGDIVRFVLANQFSHLPINSVIRGMFFVLTTPAAIGVFALPIYGFVVMLWWQPIVGIIIASMLGNIITRKILMGNNWLYIWAIIFSIASVVLFTYFLYRDNLL